MRHGPAMAETESIEQKWTRWNWLQRVVFVAVVLAIMLPLKYALTHWVFPSAH